MKASRPTIMLAALALAFGTSLAAAQKPAPSQPNPPAPPAPVPNPTQPAPQQSPAVTSTVQLPTTLPGTPQSSPSVPSPRSFEMVVRDADPLPGLFPLYEKDERVWIELKPEHFNTPYYLSINRTRGLGENMIHPFMVRGYVVEFRKIGNLVQMIAKNPRYRAKDGTPMARAAHESFTDSLIGTTTVASLPHPQRKSVLVDANALFLADIAGDSTQLEATYRASYSFDQRNSSFVKVRSTDDMATFTTSAHFAIPKIPAHSGSGKPLPSTLEDARSMFLGYHYSLAKLPDEPMAPRRADPRVGHFMTRHFDYTNDKSPFPRQYLVNRWRLEKKDPAAALSEPKKPIVFWLDRNIPVEYRDTVRAGILEWNKAFERIGFKDAIRVEIQPENADFDTADVRHASVRWYLDTSDGALAIGPRRIDPRTGEILDADIAISQGWTRLPRRLTGEQFAKPSAKVARHAGHAHNDSQSDIALCSYGNEAFQEAGFAAGLLEARDQLDPNSPQAESIVKATLKDVVTHEVGHTLGLRHNFRASTIYTDEQISDPEFTRRNGLGGSVMDYNAWNIALAKEKQGEYVMSTLGPYDYWAIEYAYKPIAPGAETKELSRIASRSTEPYLAYATDEETGSNEDAADPQVNQRDLGADPLSFARRRMALSRELWERWQNRALPPDEGRDILFRNVVAGFSQYALAAEVATKFVGGVVYVRDHAGSTRASFTPIAPERQREALKLVTDGLFHADSFKFKPEFLTRLAADPFESGVGERASFTLASRVLAVQTQALDRLMSDAVASRLLDGSFKTAEGKQHLSLSDLYDTLQASIWGDLKGKGDISLMRRNLQREHVRRVSTMLTRGGAAPADARALQRENTRSLIVQLRTAQSRPGLSKEARAHLADSLNTLQEALKAPMQRVGV